MDGLSIDPIHKLIISEFEFGRSGMNLGAMGMMACHKKTADLGWETQIDGSS
jgi:hypothetical protein